MGTSVVGAAALDLDGLEVGVQVDLDPGPVALGQLDVVDGTWDVGLALDLAHGCAGEGGQGGSPCPLDPGTGQACGAVLACRGPAVVVAVAGAVLAGPRPAIVIAVATPMPPMRSTSPAAGAAIHLLPSRIVLPPVPFSAARAATPRRRGLPLGADAVTLQTRAFAADVSQMSFLTSSCRERHRAETTGGGGTGGRSAGGTGNRAGQGGRRAGWGGTATGRRPPGGTGGRLMPPGAAGGRWRRRLGGWRPRRGRRGRRRSP